MPTTVIEQQAVLNDLTTLAVRDITDLWRDASPLGPDQFRGVITRGLPELVDPYTATASELAATWYEDAAPELTFQAAPAPLAPVEQFEASARWALHAAGEAALVRLAGTAQRAIFDAHRRTIVDNAARERGARWTRYASANACSFCRMLATRGDVYTSAQAAGEGRRYHDHCRCMAVIVRPGQTFTPPPYVEQWERDYQAAASATDGSTKAVLAHMDATERGRKASAAAATPARTPKSGVDGAKPPIKPPTGGQAVSGGEMPRRGVVDRSQVKHVEQHELDTANRLAALGYDVTFQPPSDEPRADALIAEPHQTLDWDFKSPTSGSRNTIMRQITKSAEKQQATRWVLDVNRSPMSFEEAIELSENLVGRYDDVHAIWVLAENGPDGLPRHRKIGGNDG